MAIQRLRSTAQMKALMLGAGPMAAAAGNADDAPSDDPFVVQSRSGTDWTVLYYPSIGMADSLSTPLNRTVNIVAVDHVEDALPTLRPYAQWLQTCGVALAPDRLFDVAQRVGETGIDRICPVGEMNRAKSGWHHDGGFNLLDSGACRRYRTQYRHVLRRLRHGRRMIARILTKRFSESKGNPHYAAV